MKPRTGGCVGRFAIFLKRGKRQSRKSYRLEAKSWPTSSCVYITRIFQLRLHILSVNTLSIHMAKLMLAAWI